MLHIIASLFFILLLSVSFASVAGSEDVSVPQTPAEKRPIAYALWVGPQEEKPYLHTIITELADKYGTKPFPPHVTLGTGTWNGSLDALKQEVEKFCQNLHAMPMIVEGIGLTDRPFQYFYIKLAEDDQQVFEKAQNYPAFKGIQLPDIGPHTSLMYNVLKNDITHPKTKIDLLHEQKRYLPHVPKQILCDSIVLVIPDGGVWGNNVEGWKIEQKVKLPLHQTAK